MASAPAAPGEGKYDQKSFGRTVDIHVVQNPRTSPPVSTSPATGMSGPIGKQCSYCGKLNEYNYLACLECPTAYMCITCLSQEASCLAHEGHRTRMHQWVLIRDEKDLLQTIIKGKVLNTFSTLQTSLQESKLIQSTGAEPVRASNVNSNIAPPPPPPSPTTTNTTTAPAATLTTSEGSAVNNATPGVSADTVNSTFNFIRGVLQIAAGLSSITSPRPGGAPHA